ncbi:hypothetical protein TanjilG_04486 [Lupinus angustifolius]|uniref:DUF3527 domain-containing protein n=1 Tax=Lupinus angustifolius TaxID=3871 RepID=A0A4P1RQP5_LUPAN|nr:PREDICTED: uncharacterized protein LOC109342955 [Lupinus angustifolius]XP_019436588.1 PREDICTED: uncharacterized protein LOC109342955 [Lupinus angustifolius]XP_019436589.1 PREDICTED: uncharacterized protein LOC109342955 [Lupinus angustifolius]OIW15951.1 hypothetical protein TanjilG_04486 [Lupinus angustifolius]
MSRKLHERLIPEKSSLSYADFHQEITKCEKGNSINSHGKQKKQVTCGRVSKDDELVKYMSTLPGYLEKGQKIGDKALNVGVLDWGRLEQWRYGHKQVPHRSSGSSTSTSNTSSSVSTDALSGSSTRGRSLSCYRQRISRPSLQSHLIVPPMDDHSVSVKPFGGSVGNCQNLRGSQSNFATQSKYVRADDLLSQNHPTSIMKGCNKKYLSPHIDTETDKLPNDRRYEAASCAKIVKSTQDVGMQKRLDNLQESNIDTFEKATLTKTKALVVLMPREVSQSRHSGASSMRTSFSQKFGSPTRTRLSGKPKEPSHRYPNHDAPHSCFLPVVNSRSHSQPKGSAPSSIDPEKINTPASTLPAPLPVKMGTSPCRSRKAEERKHTVASSAIEPPQIVDQKVTAEKSRSSSPFRRFTISLGFAGKGSGCKDVAHVPHQNSMAAPKSCSENAIGYASTNVSGNVKPGYAGRSTTSPLRRLLDPLLKPKAANCRRYIELSKNDSVLINKNCRPGNVKPSTSLPEKELDMDHGVDCTTTKAADSSKQKKYGLPTFHALLRIAVKNGHPLFTFVVDNNSEILAATMKNLTVTRKDECHSIYTFFTFREVKKKNGSWMNQAGKSKGPDYIHHAVAQMKVSESHCFDSTSQNCMDSSTAKVFVLFSVKVRQGDAQVTDYQPNDELAAIVVKSRKAINFVSRAHQNICQNDSQDLVHVTAVLPSGVHSLPSDGGPSSLIERWKTGGACDCGGWDLGCKLQILANQNQSSRNSRTSKAYIANQFELFLQGNDQDQENQPCFSFAPFKPGIYSVAFDSSLSILQAFSTCIALVDGKMSYENSKPRSSTEGKDLTETLMVQTEELKDFVKLENIPASYIAYPPVSPVGRF